MRKWFSPMVDAVKVFLVFAMCTTFFYYGILWISAEYESDHRFEEPQGRAVKVIEMFEEPGPSVWLERLLFFYRHGE
ncbi:YqzK family protein [Bacillus sp. FJAT-44742]|uniref:YqzK family protein n=1 Tax=Bacillus sp. FJAT-44742 TaxID=2014005 RepID=UPI000C250DC0|nr:YqzK family protein [Bacillus sp. FJAT-44742]